ncbi:auxin efflux carrier [Sistotremastrum niveocremeum HHB9708]|uniref:Auxin efflux carrier n=1 Tax=Sistotremastrum niveocremeum HHB9708 TaxID=1314777 RepID=A0A164SQL1_9AGAM|nr:auxin efflux carrier [Sistotremastrum niveocremeum HHB9708]
MGSPSVGALIWISVRPLIRLVATTASGYLITRADLFPTVAARGTGQVLLNITLPCLMFSKIVPAFTPENIAALGPLTLVAVVYQLLGLLLSIIIKQFFWVPHRFRYGILVAGCWGNSGDVPTAVIMSITAVSPFGGTKDSTLAVAYISVFILVTFISLFPLGGHKLVAWDYAGPDEEDNEVKQKLKARNKRLLTSAHRIIRHRKGSSPDIDIENTLPSVIEKIEKIEPSELLTPISERRARFAIEEPILPHSEPGSRPMSPTPSQLTTVYERQSIAKDTESPSTPSTPPTPSPPPTRWHSLRAHLIEFLKSLLSPPCFVILLSLLISLVNPLKGLFTPVPSLHIPNAPDGDPPLAFVLDTAQFVGAASVPLGLITLGSALARLRVPRGDWGKLPMGAIGGLAIGKTVIMPFIGVLICQGLTRVRIIDEGDKVLRFVCIFFSCIPTATTQVFLTQVYSGTGTAENLAAFLIPQYFLMVFSMTALTAYTLHMLF